MARTSRPSITLGIPGDPYTLFYDYDQIEEHKLTSLTKEQKAIWFERRLRMAFLEPLRRIWKEHAVFESLLESKLNTQAECSFSIASMGIMLNVVEALGSFRRPELAQDDWDSSWRMFHEFFSNHMRAWNVSVASNISVPTVLWTSFRNGITHGLRVGQVSQPGGLWGSLEFRGNFTDSTRQRFEKQGQLLRVCPEDFFDDIVAGVSEYFDKLREGSDLLDKFESRFDVVYPNRLVGAGESQVI